MRSREPTANTSRKVVFTFPGQGSYRRELLRELFTDRTETRAYFERSDEVSRRFFGRPFLPLVVATSNEEHDEYLSAFPALDQIGIYLTEVLVAKLLRQRGIRPDLLLGHSFGDLAALATAGVFSYDEGLKIICQRALFLEAIDPGGRMASVSCGRRQVERFLAELPRHSIEISVLNHPGQTVLSGIPSELEELRARLNREGRSLSFLKSRYPFHSSLLQDAVRPFEISLRSYEFQPPATPVSLCTEGAVYSAEHDLPAVLAAQLTARLDFMGLLEGVLTAGYSHFFECGAGDILSKIIRKNSEGGKAPVVEPVAEQGGGLERGLGRVLKLAEEGGLMAVEPAADRDAGELARGNGDSRLREVRFLLTRATALLDNGSRRWPREQVVKTFPEESCRTCPIAVVALGCVLPGAADPEVYWENVRHGVSGIVDLVDLDPRTAMDFLSPRVSGEIQIVPDKTYALLNGTIPTISHDPELLSFAYGEEEFDALTRGQKLLALATGQSLARLSGGALAHGQRVQCILGSTADGSSEYDEAMFSESLRRWVADLAESEDLRQRFTRRLDDLLGYRDGQASELTQHRTLKAVVDRMLPPGVRTYLLDAACSSSLYAINLGIKALRGGSADVVLAGGVFAPGPANNALFAQFRGLTPSGSRPLDAAADGVVFGDGAALVVLKRLPEALAEKDRILGVIRGMGVSSDGKSPSINVPRSPGQVLAVGKAYENAGVDPGSIQYIEAHATATPVGDAVEFTSLNSVFGAAGSHPAPIELGSVKALIGHTGWVSGVASLIKLLKAFESEVVPPQYNYDSPNPDIDLRSSPFTISTAAHRWPENIGGYPRRAGINGFGFGGTNAHLVVEAFDDAYHRNLCTHLQVAERQGEALAVVGVGRLFPAAGELAAEQASSVATFQRERLRLPNGKILLPDVTDHMDPSQYLGALAAEKILTAMPEAYERLKEVTGVVLGLESKTERGVTANERIYLDRLRRLFGDGGKGDEARLLERVVSAVRSQVIPSGPYTLPGLMPNVAASRTSSLFDLKGPNVVVDMGRSSLLQALAVAAEFLRHGDCRMVLAGGLNALGCAADSHAEGVLLLALATPRTAESEGLPVVATLRLEDHANQEPGQQGPDQQGPDYRGASGMVEVLKALERAAAGERALVQEESQVEPCRSGKLVFSFAGPPASGPSASGPPAPGPPAPAPQAPAEAAGAYAYVQGTPIHCYAPELVPSPATASASSLEMKRILFLTDQPGRWQEIERSGVLDNLRYRVVVPADEPLAGSLAIDLTSEETSRSTAAVLDDVELDTLIVVKDLVHHRPETLLSADPEKERRLTDLLFAVTRRLYETIQGPETSLVTLCWNAFRDVQPDPYTGLLAGFLKSLSRELPAARCKSLCTDTASFASALRQLAGELAQDPDPVEIFYRGDQRSVYKLKLVDRLARDGISCLTSESVVVATGGGRGVTAVLAEEILTRWGCTVIALGRTDPTKGPPEIRQMSEPAFREYESRFYREELARDRKQKITELKRRYQSYQAINELSQVIERLRALPGRFEYHPLDINDPAGVDGFVAGVERDYGRLDLVLHGAGIQKSQVLSKKSLADFRRIVATKLSSLAHFYQACGKRFEAGAVHYHLLTSAFSYLGNDGQPDYGAANEAMSRVAAAMSRRGEPACWSSMAWLGWAGIGMTRGSEFAALAAHRGLRGVTREEGKAIFRGLMQGRATSPTNVLLADGEIRFYRPDLLASPQARRQDAEAPNSLTVPIDLTIETASYVLDHTVRGVPTLPGSFITGIAADAAQKLRPELKIVAFQDTRFLKFVRVYPARPTRLRVEARIVSEEAREALVRVRILSDFVHKSGLVLEKDIVQTETVVRMAAERHARPRAAAMAPPNGNGLRLPDPYALEGSPVRLNGAFDSLSNLVVCDDRRFAEYRLPGLSYPDSPFRYLLPNIIMVDAFWRFGTVQPVGEHTLAVYVPQACRKMNVFFDYTDFGLSTLKRPFTFSGANPRLEDDLLHVGTIEARGVDGELMLSVEGGVCRKYGEIPNAF